jgi:YjbE family integral membrane protein
MHFLLSGLSIVLIDLLLAGDNALVIAMAVRSLPPRERRIGIVGGAAVAVVLRIGLTVVAARLLEIDYVKLAGGLLILWIAYKVLVDASAEPDSVSAPHRFWQAIWYIVVADLTMSTDNILAIAAASHGSFWLITFGLALSIPFVVMSSNLLSKLMDRYPATIYLGAGLLGKVGGEMIMTDGFIKRTLGPSNGVLYGVEAALTIFFVVLGWRMCTRKR